MMVIPGVGTRRALRLLTERRREAFGLRMQEWREAERDGRLQRKRTRRLRMFNTR